MITHIRVRYYLLGAHVHANFWTVHTKGNDDAECTCGRTISHDWHHKTGCPAVHNVNAAELTHGKSGELIFTEPEWEAFTLLIMAGQNAHLARAARVELINQFAEDNAEDDRPGISPSDAVRRGISQPLTDS